MPIRILPADVASQIAAGEVVERPASVVKELMENSLDAGASHISVQIIGAGKGMIMVSDNGIGMSSQDLSLAIERHATSKLTNADDLFHIDTLGFRGEALASIGSVSRLTITSRMEGQDSGNRIKVEAGRIVYQKSIGAPRGTSVLVKDLFHNVPARLEFLKTDRTELRQIDDIVTRYAIANPEVRCELFHKEKKILQTSGLGDRRETLGAVVGVESSREMLEVIAEEDGISVNGFISPTTRSKSNRRDIYFFVNGRPIQDPSLVTALTQAYHTMLMVGRYPIAYLFLQVPPDFVDVNVHPTKAEVRFKNPQRVFRAVQRAARRSLLAHTPIPEINQNSDWLQSAWRSYSIPSEQGYPGENLVGPNWKVPDSVEMPETQTKSHHPSLGTLKTPILRLIGQVGAAYLVAEGPDGIYLIDQHAAHERVLFEQYIAAYEKEKENNDRIDSQGLLQPVAIEFSTTNSSMLEEHLDIINRLGFVVEPFGSNTFIVRQVPTLLTDIEPEAALRILIDDFEEDESPLQQQVEARIIARVCKRAAIKAGQVLSGEEQQRLLSDLEQCQSPRTCPHGRPTMIHLSVDILERQFGRKGSHSGM